MLEERTIYWVECDECSDCTPDFNAENNALRWAAENGWEVGERTLCPECRPDFLICNQCGRKQSDQPPHPTGYVRRADDGSPFDDWSDRWLVRDGERGALTTGMSNAMNATSTKAATQTRSNTTAGRSKNAPSAPNVQNNQRKG